MSNDARVVVVTGASGPMGRGIVSALAAGSVVVGVSRNRVTDGDEDHWLEADICDDAQVGDVIRDVYESFGRLDVLINNAGAGTPRADIDDFDLAEWRRIIDVNVTGTFTMLRGSARLLRRSPCGRVVNISSMAGLQPLPRMAAYATSKSALVGLTRAAARELAPSCTVNAVAPGYMDDGMANAVLADDIYSRFVFDRTPAKRLGTMAEVGSLVRFLCSEDAGFITGQTIAIDGGWTLV